MNFSTAIQAHTNWKVRLHSHCRSSSKDVIDIAGLAKDDACELGRWLHSKSPQYAADPKFTELLAEHASFHRAAASVATLIEAGTTAQAEALINSPDSDYCKVSLRVVSLLMDFRRKYADD